MCGAQDRSGGVDHRGVAYCLALLILDSLHGLKLGHAVGELSGTGDKGLDIVLDSRLVESMYLANERINRIFLNPSPTGKVHWLHLPCMKR